MKPSRVTRTENIRARLTKAEYEKLAYVNNMTEAEVAEAVANYRQPKLDSEPLDYAQFEMPESFASKPHIFNIPIGSRVGIMSDLHFPYQDNVAIQICLAKFKREGVGAIVINGDAIDCYQLSRFEKRPNKRSFKQEIDALKFFLQTLRKHFPKAGVHYKLGNHEERWERWLSEKPEIHGLAELTWANLLGLDALGITLVEGYDIIKAGILTIEHGHEVMGGGKYHAANKLARVHTNYVFGHNHRPQTWSEADMYGSRKSAWAIGCLCGLWPDYARTNQWQHGFGIADIESEDYFSFHNYTIIDKQVRPA